MPATKKRTTKRAGGRTQQRAVRSRALTTHTALAHGLILATLQAGADATNCQAATRDIVTGDPNVTRSTTSLFEDERHPGTKGDVVAVQLDLNLATGPQAHAVMDNLVQQIQALGCFKPGVKHW